MQYATSLLASAFVTQDTRRFTLERPDGFSFTPGQGVQLTIEHDPWCGQEHPFTPTSLPSDRVLEFVIKRYGEGDGFTRALHGAVPGAPMTIGEAFGTIRYKGPGVFIAAGTGITPFLAILRQLAIEGNLEGHELLFSNKTEEDLICGQELRHYLGDRAVFTFTRHHEMSHEGKHVDSGFLTGHVGNLDRHFYVCGPDVFVESVNKDLITLGTHPDRLVYEH